MERESRNNRKKKRPDLAKYLRDYLKNRYSNVLWVVVVYDDVSGWDAHTVIGHYYHLFRHYGHNIVVSRITEPFRRKAPVDIGGKFNRALSITWKKKRVNARPTAEATWRNIYGQGLYPVMVHVVKGGKEWAVSTDRNSRVYHQKLSDGGLAVLLAIGK